jgi:hypothetical protein
MRIAMLSPIAWRTPPRHYGPRDMGLSYSYLEERTFTKGEMPW